MYQNLMCICVYIAGHNGVIAEAIVATIQNKKFINSHKVGSYTWAQFFISAFLLLI